MVEPRLTPEILDSVSAELPDKCNSIPIIYIGCELAGMYTECVLADPALGMIYVQKHVINEVPLIGVEIVRCFLARRVGRDEETEQRAQRHADRHREDCQGGYTHRRRQGPSQGDGQRYLHRAHHNRSSRRRDLAQHRHQVDRQLPAAV